MCKGAVLSGSQILTKLTCTTFPGVDAVVSPVVKTGDDRDLLFGTCPHPQQMAEVALSVPGICSPVHSALCASGHCKVYACAGAAEVPPPGGGIKRGGLSHSSGGWESKVKVWAGLVPSEDMREHLFQAPLLASGGHCLNHLFL